MDAGSVYLFRGTDVLSGGVPVPGTTGGLLAAIPNPAPVAGSNFGVFPITAVGSKFVVGAPLDDPGGVADAGSVYVYDGTVGALILAIPNPEPAASDFFGTPAITAVGANFVVGVPRDDPTGVLDGGSVYLYDGTSGTLLLAIPNPTPDVGDFFGFHVAAVAGNFVVSAVNDDTAGASDPGAVYLYDGTTGTTSRSTLRRPSKNKTSRRPGRWCKAAEAPPRGQRAPFSRTRATSGGHGLRTA